MKKLLNLNNLFLTVIFCIPLYLIKVNIFGIPSNIFEMLALLAIILAVIQEKKRSIRKLLELPFLFTASCALILFGLLLSIFFNNNQLVGFGIFKSWFLIPMLFSFTLYLLLDSDLVVEKIFKSIYYSSATVGLIAVAYKLFEITTYDGRLTAFYLSPNHLAMYLSPGVFFGFYFLQKKPVRKAIFPPFLLTMILIPLYFTFSYGAWIAVFISLLFLIPITASLKKKMFIFFPLIFLCGSLIFISQKDSQKFDSLLNQPSRSSLASRTTIWQVSLHLIKDDVLFGVGPGNFQPAYLSLQKYYPPYLEWAVPQPHNIFLAFALQTGLIGLIGFLSLLFFIFQTFWKIFKDKKNTALAAPLFGFFLYTIIHGLVDTTYWKNDLAFLFWLCLFLVIYIFSLTPNDDHN